MIMDHLYAQRPDGSRLINSNLTKVPAERRLQESTRFVCPIDAAFLADHRGCKDWVHIVNSSWRFRIRLHPPSSSPFEYYDHYSYQNYRVGGSYTRVRNVDVGSREKDVVIGGNVSCF